ncbi:MAG: hypothetical protein ACI4OJ_09595, partial [Lachnospiraceae bacterium]
KADQLHGDLLRQLHTDIYIVTEPVPAASDKTDVFVCVFALHAKSSPGGDPPEEPAASCFEILSYLLITSRQITGA